MLKRMNTMKLAVAGLLFSASFLTQANDTIEKVVASKNINWGNAIKATVLSGTSLCGVWFYYKSIIEPYIMILAKNKGLGYAIKFNKDFVLNNPGLAALYATPLFFAVFQAIIAHDYAKNIMTEKIQ